MKKNNDKQPTDPLTPAFISITRWLVMASVVGAGVYPLDMLRNQCLGIKGPFNTSILFSTLTLALNQSLRRNAVFSFKEDVTPHIKNPTNIAVTLATIETTLISPLVIRQIFARKNTPIPPLNNHVEKIRFYYTGASLRFASSLMSVFSCFQLREYFEKKLVASELINNSIALSALAATAAGFTSGITTAPITCLEKTLVSRASADQGKVIKQKILSTLVEILKNHPKRLMVSAPFNGAIAGVAFFLVDQSNKFCESTLLPTIQEKFSRKN